MCVLSITYTLNLQKELRDMSGILKKLDTEYVSLHLILLICLFLALYLKTVRKVILLKPTNNNLHLTISW
jgi:hypothetical protein